MSDLPETILQFGGGRFLRGFADLFVHQMNTVGQAVGRVVVVQSTPGERANLLNTQHGQYHVVVRGLENGETVERVEESASIRRALVAQTEWSDVLAFARSRELRYVLSNTTETGLALDPADRPDDAPPRSFPGKLAVLLSARHAAGLPGVTLLPCELLEDNAIRLRTLVLEQSHAWSLSDAFTGWLQTECSWRNTLVDRIVTDAPADHPLRAEDGLLVTAEPYALWAIETEPNAALFTHPAIVPTADVKPYTLRKVRILNAAHTALVYKAIPRGFKIVREAVLDPEIGDWLRALLFEEIVPTLEGRVVEPEAFARQTLERFANPFLEHKLADIALYHETKIQIRLKPTYNEYQERFGRIPPKLTEIVANVGN